MAENKIVVLIKYNIVELYLKRIDQNCPNECIKSMCILHLMEGTNPREFRLSLTTILK
jgi:hypothetical protein